MKGFTVSEAVGWSSTLAQLQCIRCSIYKIVFIHPTELCSTISSHSLIIFPMGSLSPSVREIRLQAVDDGTARCGALVDGSCSVSSLDSAGRPGSSTQSLTSDGSWAHAWQCPWAASRAYTRISRHRICQSNISASET